MDLDLNHLILWSDDSLLAVNKPAGLATLPEGWEPSAPHLKSILEPRYGPLWIIHRLDKETSGIVLLGRTAGAHRELNGQFERHLVEKVYHALVSGNPVWDEKRVDLPLRLNVGRRHRTAIDPQRGKPAVTGLRVLSRFQAAALLEVRPQTGRTHQIRAHLAAIGHPILGDPLYGPMQEAQAVPGIMQRLGLHALSLEFNHPTTGGRLLLEAPYPDDFSAALGRLARDNT